VKAKKVKEEDEKKKPVIQKRNEDIVDMTLDEVIENVLRYNPDVKNIRLEWAASSSKVRAAWGVFEPQLSGGFERNASDRENTVLQSLQQSGLQEYYESNRIYTAALEGKFLTGAGYNVGYSANDIRNNLTQSDESTAFAGLTVTQPLLKGAWYGSPWAEISVAKIDRLIAFNNLRAKMMKAVYEAESTYWNLAFAEEKARIASGSVEIAKKLVHDSKERLKSGKMSSMDLLEAEAGLAMRQVNYADVQQELLEADNQLKLLLTNEEINEDTRIRTKTKMTSAVEKMNDLLKESDMLRQSVQLQPDYLVKRYELERGKYYSKIPRESIYA
jgi:outer membrane protein TolC